MHESNRKSFSLAPMLRSKSISTAKSQRFRQESSAYRLASNSSASVQLSRCRSDAARTARLESFLDLNALSIGILLRDVSGIGDSESTHKYLTRQGVVCFPSRKAAVLTVAEKWQHWGRRLCAAAQTYTEESPRLRTTHDATGRGNVTNRTEQRC